MSCAYPGKVYIYILYIQMDMLQYLPNSVKMIHIFIYPIDNIYREVVANAVSSGLCVLWDFVDLNMGWAGVGGRGQ